MKKEIAQQNREILNAFMISHSEYPYATQAEKQWLSQRTGMDIKAITQFMTNWRRRHVLNPNRQKYRRRLYK